MSGALYAYDCITRCSQVMCGATHIVGIGADVERSEAWCFTLAKTGVCEFYAEYIVIIKKNKIEQTSSEA